MRFIDLPKRCPLCDGDSLGDPISDCGVWYVQCWNRSCRGSFEIFGLEETVKAVTKLVKRSGLEQTKTGKTEKEKS
jgi:hypothetical protein